ncbi:MAG: hypothetical protein ACTSWK_07445 [Promethearchaeota archaeon]
MIQIIKKYAFEIKIANYCYLKRFALTKTEYAPLAITNYGGKFFFLIADDEGMPFNLYH